MKPSTDPITIRPPTEKQLGTNIEFGIEELRHMVKNFDYCNETFNQTFSLPELVIIHRAWMGSGWDIFPDTWTLRQVKEALKGISPDWEHDESTPKYKKDSE